MLFYRPAISLDARCQFVYTESCIARIKARSEAKYWVIGKIGNVTMLLTTTLKINLNLLQLRYIYIGSCYFSVSNLTCYHIS